MSDVQAHIMQVRRENIKYAAEAYSFLLSDTTGEYSDILTGSIPEAKTDVTGQYILGLMLEVEKYALPHSFIPCLLNGPIY